jgi:hypothetical protein
MPPLSAVFRREASPIVSFQRVERGSARKFRVVAEAGAVLIIRPPDERRRLCGGGAFEKQAGHLDVIGEPRFGCEMGFGTGLFLFGFPWNLSPKVNIFNGSRGLSGPKYFQRAPAQPKRPHRLQAEPLAFEILAPGDLPHEARLPAILLARNCLENGLACPNGGAESRPANAWTANLL